MTVPADKELDDLVADRYRLMDSADMFELVRKMADAITALRAERDALLKVVGDACDWVGVLDTTNDVANHALRKQWIVRARAALKEPTK